MKLAACVILYNPENDQLENIKSYFDSIDYLFIYDNSPNPRKLNFDFISEKKYEYIANGNNVGIAKALNFIAKKVQSMGYNWLLTMDQDSHFYMDSFKKLKDSVTFLDQKKNEIGIISPVHVDATKIEIGENKIRFSEVDIVMTSGNIVNLNAWQDIGFFEEKLFIDGVDYDFCLRLLLKKYKIFIDNNSFLIHPVGDIKNIVFLGKKVQIAQHNHIRIYYMVRNGTYLVKKYFKYFPKQSASLLFQQIINPIKILMFENQKGKKIKFYFLGVKDFWLSRFGKERYS